MKCSDPLRGWLKYFVPWRFSQKLTIVLRFHLNACSSAGVTELLQVGRGSRVGEGLFVGLLVLVVIVVLVEYDKWRRRSRLVGTRE
jgi:hypothetical protein